MTCRLLRVGAGFDLSDADPRARLASPAARPGRARPGRRRRHLSELQERLYAETKGGADALAAAVVQGMDTSGKGGIVRHVVGAGDPQGIRHTAFKAPTNEERAKGFLWRIRQALPQAGEIGVFDRSHYEDVLIARVHGLVPQATWSKRYATINDFEARLADRGTTIVKVMLHISPESRRRGCPNGWSARTSTGSTTRATSTSACGGTTTRRPTRSR